MNRLLHPIVALAALALAVVPTRTPAQPASSCPLDTTPKTARWVRAQQRVVAKGLPPFHYTTTASIERQEIAYIRACGALGDYYAARFDLTKAMTYYEKVIYLKSGTDGDIGDNNSYLERNKVACRVATLYNWGRLDVESLKSPYVGHFIEERIANGPVVFGESFTDTTVVRVPFRTGASRLGQEARGSLRRVAAAIGAGPARMLLLVGESGCGSYVEMQVAWARAAAVRSFLTDSCRLPEDRFIFQYCSGNAGSRIVKRENDNTVTLRYAPPGHEGPPMLAPPMLHLFAIENPWKEN